MKQKVIKVGNSAGVTLPYEIREQAGLKLGDSVIVGMQDNAIVITPLKKKQKKVKGVDAKFMKIVDEFIDDHEDVLKELANR